MAFSWENAASDSVMLLGSSDPISPYDAIPNLLEWNILGFGVGNAGPAPIRGILVTVPYWFLVSGLGLGALAWLYHLVNRRPKKRGSFPIQ